MNPIYTKLNLKQYITRASNQKEVLQLSTIISDDCKNLLSLTYDLQVQLATNELAVLEAEEMEVSYEVIGSITTI